MISYKNLGFRIMVLNDNKYKLSRNFLVIDRAIVGNVSLPPPPKHFKYVEEERYHLCFYTFTVDENDPSPPASLLHLSNMSIKRLKAIASRNDLGGWATLGKPDLVKFLKRHRYIFSDDFYKQKSLPNQIRAWVELFANNNNFTEHYTEIMLNTLTKSGYYKPTNQIEYYCWWKGLPLDYSKDIKLFLSKPNSFLVFEREMDVRIKNLIRDTEELFREIILRVEGASSLWIQEWRRKWGVMLKKINETGVVWSKEEKDKFFSQLKESLVKKVLQIGDA